jgi:helicase
VVNHIDSREIETFSSDNIINLVISTLKKNKQILIFNSSKRNAQATAKNIANNLPDNLIENKEELEKISEKILKSLSQPTSQCRLLAELVKKGVAFHHSGLVSKQRDLIETGFKKGLIKVISSTPTLAAGLNLPAYKVIIKDYKRYSQRGIRDIPILEYFQMAGRAGRPGKEKEGVSVICVGNETEAQRIAEKYIFGEPEEILSKLAIEPTLKMHVLSLIATDIINTKDEIKHFFANTLYAHQFKDLEEIYFNIFRIINQLISYGFIEQDDNYYMATKIGKRISELYLNPDTAHEILENIDKIFKRFEKIPISRTDIYALINFLSNTMEMKPLFKVKKIEQEKYYERLENINYLFIDFDPYETDIENLLDSLKTTDILMDWIYEAPEKYLEEKYGVTPGELNYKIETMDWLLYSLEEICLLKKNYFLKNYLNKLRIRFKYGIKEELIPFVSLKGIGRVKARKLFNAGFKTLSDLRLASFEQLKSLLGEKLAKQIKILLNAEDSIESNKMLGEKPKEIKVRELPAEEIENIVHTIEEYEKEKEEKQKTLTDFF